MGKCELGPLLRNPCFGFSAGPMLICAWQLPFCWPEPRPLSQPPCCVHELQGGSRKAVCGAIRPAEWRTYPPIRQCLTLAPPSTLPHPSSPCQLSLTLAARSHPLTQPAYARPRNVLVFINPFSGSRRSRHTWQSHVMPVFLKARIRFTVIETTEQVRCVAHSWTCFSSIAWGFIGMRGSEAGHTTYFKARNTGNLIKSVA